MDKQLDVLQGTLDMLILKAVSVPGELVRCQGSTQCHIVTLKQNNNSPDPSTA